MNATFRPKPWHLRRGRCAAQLGVALLVSGAAAAHAETLDEYLSSGALKSITNPVPINYFLDQAPGSLAEADRARAMEEVNLALRRQTNLMNKMVESMSGMLAGSATQQVMQQTRQQMSATSLIKQELLGHFGVNAPAPEPTQRQVQAMQEEARQGITDPWIRGIESARARERVGDVQGAARFYMDCIQFVPHDWLADTCLNEILAMGPARAHALLVWMAANASSVGTAGMSPPGRVRGPTNYVVQLRAAALRGLGELVGSDVLTPEQRESALQPILGYAQGKDNSPYYAAAADGLGRARDPRGLEPLHQLAGYRKDKLVEEAALRALAVGFHQEDALKQLRRRLDDKSAEVQFAAADALLAADDEAVYQWAQEIITSRRAPDEKTVDLRPRVVRTLVAHPEARSRQALQEILHHGAGNDWLDAWIAVGLLEMGDDTQLAAVRAAVRKTDWALDRATLGSAWRSIRPLVREAFNAAVKAAVGGPIPTKEIVQVVLNFASGQLAKASEFAADREIASLQLRYQACEAFALTDASGAAEELRTLIGDQQPAVRLSAARALALQPSRGSLDGLIAAYHADFGEEDGTSRTPEVRAALLRAVLSRAPDDPRTSALVHEAAASPDAGIRFIGLVAATHVAAGRQ